MPPDVSQDFIKTVSLLAPKTKSLSGPLGSKIIQTPIPSQTKEEDVVKLMFYVLKRNFGFTSFRNGQARVIRTILKRTGGLLVSMPTGGGKSMLYQMVALLESSRPNQALNYFDQQPKIVVVVQPIIALVNEQTQIASKCQLSALGWHHETDPAEVDLQLALIATRGGIIFTTPGCLVKLISRQDKDLCSQVAYIFVDECHCA